MIKNATIKVYVPVKAKNSEATVINTWGYKQVPALPPSETIRGDSQPKTLTEAQLVLFGIDSSKANTKVLYIGKTQFIRIGTRVHIAHDRTPADDGYYDVKGANLWPNHGEIIVLPVQGEA